LDKFKYFGYLYLCIITLVEQPFNWLQFAFGIVQIYGAFVFSGELDFDWPDDGFPPDITVGQIDTPEGYQYSDFTWSTPNGYFNVNVYPLENGQGFYGALNVVSTSAEQTTIVLQPIGLYGGWVPVANSSYTVIWDSDGTTASIDVIFTGAAP